VKSSDAAKGSSTDIPVEFNLCDVYLRSPTSAALFSDSSISSEMSPMSGVNGLSHFVCPSLTSSQQIKSLILLDEEKACKDICNNISEAIEAEGGESAPPPTKKRGLGAETLAHTQALLKCSAKRPQWLSLLSGATAVIEAMQRSSGKQYVQLCDWRCSYDVRAAREALLFGRIDASMPIECSQEALINAADIAVGTLVEFIRTSAERSGTLSKDSKGSESTTSGPVDVEHILMMLISAVFRIKAAPSEERMSELRAHIMQFIVLRR
jgi:hypothetical protein